MFKEINKSVQQLISTTEEAKVITDKLVALAEKKRRKQIILLALCTITFFIGVVI